MRSRRCRSARSWTRRPDSSRGRRASALSAPTIWCSCAGPADARRWRGTRCASSSRRRAVATSGVQVAIDTPRARQDVNQPFMIAGWAADLDAAVGTGIDTLHVWAYPSTGGAPIFLGTPTLGGVTSRRRGGARRAVPRSGLRAGGPGSESRRLRSGRVPVEQRDRRVCPAKYRETHDPVVFE